MSCKMTIEQICGAVESPLFDRKSARIDAKALAVHLIAFANADGGVIAVGVISFLLSRFVDCLVAGISVFVDLTVSNTPETARAGQPGAETANAGKHIKVSDQSVSSPSCSDARKPRTSSLMLPACGASCAIWIWLPCNS